MVPAVWGDSRVHVDHDVLGQEVSVVETCGSNVRSWVVARDLIKVMRMEAERGRWPRVALVVVVTFAAAIAGSTAAGSTDVVLAALVALLAGGIVRLASARHGRNHPRSR
jgi:hypothetical protein